MINLKNYKIDSLNRRIPDMSYAIELEESKKIEKASIFSDTMFKAMFQNDGRIKYSCKLISYFVDISYEQLLKSLHFTKNEIGKYFQRDKGCRGDYFAEFEGNKINIEVNAHASVKTLERNVLYTTRTYGEKVKVGSEYDFNYVLQLNINNFSFQGINDTYTINLLKDDHDIAITDKIIIVQIFVPNVYKKLYNKGKESLSELEKFLVLLTDQYGEFSRSLIEGDLFMEDYLNESKQVSNEDEFVSIYDKEVFQRKILEMVSEEKGMEKGRLAKEKEAAVNFYQNGASKELICKSLNITEEQLDEYLEYTR